VLTELNIHDFALTREASMHLSRSLNVLTGETGAGKSILIDAIQILLGSRASQIKIRTGAKSARVEGLFTVDAGQEELISLLAEAGIEIDEGQIVIRRELFAGEPSRCAVNGYLVPAGLLRTIGGLLVDFHGQQESSSLKDPASQLRLLDAYGGQAGKAKEIRSLYDERSALKGELAAITDELGEIRDRVAHVSEDIDDIDSVMTAEGVEEELFAEKALLENFEQITTLSGIIFDVLSDDEHGVNSTLAGLDHDFAELSRLAGELGEARRQFDEARYSLEEVARKLGAFVQDVEYDPDRLESIRQKLGEIARVKRKFGKTVEEVMKYREWAISCVNRKKDLEERREALERELSLAERRLLAEAVLLSTLRREAAGTLEEETERGMKSLGLEHGRFRIEFEGRSGGDPAGGTVNDVGRSGLDRIRFMVSMNRGEPLLPLSQVASGGELSRIMLAMKTAIADKDRTATLVFDEIDAGIGGEVGLRVGEKLADIARSHQVLVVTHLPQIAVRAFEHFHVRKVEEKNGSTIFIRKLGWDERTSEISRMLGGDPMSTISQAHAREMLGAAGWGDGVKR
jgi:DNA repair protein RecN (Recombination protein N)